MTSLADLVLQPGEWFFGQSPNRISTLLGSCVAVTVWHPILRCGGLCHYLLPARPKSNECLTVPNARYGVDALELLRCEMTEYAPLLEYHIGCFGGAEMFAGNQQVGTNNVVLAQKWMRLHAITPQREALGGHLARKIWLDLATGNVQVDVLAVDRVQGDRL